jgi:alpha-methylacyl-CoA racemase
MSGFGALDGVRVIEIAGIGPAPFAAMMLADMGADVIRVDRVDPAGLQLPHPDMMSRGRRSIAVDLKRDDGRDIVIALAATADVLIEGFRPGVAERLGIGPEVCMKINPKLVYGRMTGWGQDGPLAARAGHDIDYIALTGALDAIGRAGDRPVPPINLLGDFGGGGMFLAFGVVCALLSARVDGVGQVVDTAIVDGVNSLTVGVRALRELGMWPGGRGQNLLDGGAPNYDTYECADGKFVAVGALEPQFQATLFELTGLEASAGADEWARVFRTRTRDEWIALLGEHDACVAPVLDWNESTTHPHAVARHSFIERDGVVQPAPAPRLSRTPGSVRRSPPRPGEHTDEVLAEIGRGAAEIARLRSGRTVA